jgi:hypothetical protein
MHIGLMVTDTVTVTVTVTVTGYLFFQTQSQWPDLCVLFCEMS